MYVLLAFLTIISSLFLANNFLQILFSLENYKIHKKRLKQLQIKARQERSNDEQVQDLIQQLTVPVSKHIMPKLKLSKLDELQIKLKLAKWNNYFTPKTFIAFNLTLKIIAVIIFLLLMPVSMAMGALWGSILFFIPSFLLNNFSNATKEKLTKDFPDLIRIIQGYLVADYPFVLAITEALPDVSDEWRIFLQDLVANADTLSTEDALDLLKGEIDIFEVKEFVAFVKLNLEQGGDIRSGFQRQIDKLQELQELNMELAINKRQTLALVIQAPLLLCNLLVFALPTVHQALTTF